MIRHLHPTDSPALLQFKQRSGLDEARSLPQAIKGAPRSFPLVKYTTIALSPRAWQSCWVKTRRAVVQTVFRAGPRSGPAAWELSELFIAKNSRDVAIEVLEQLAFSAGSSGARRVFLRLPADSEIFDAARAAGYTPVYSETLFRTESARQSLLELDEEPGEPGALELRPLEPEDQHAMYRLFCAAVPIDVRTRVGQTLEEWSSSREKAGRKSRDRGIEDPVSGALQAVVTSCDVPGGRYFSAQTRTDMGGSVKSLVAAELEQAGDRPVLSLVPSYDQNMSETVGAVGFTPGQTYDVMVKTMAVTVTEPVHGFAAIER